MPFQPVCPGPLQTFRVTVLPLDAAGLAPENPVEMRPDAVFSPPADLVTPRAHAEQILAALRITDLVGLRHTSGDHGRHQPRHSPARHSPKIPAAACAGAGVGHGRPKTSKIRPFGDRRRIVIEAGCVVMLSPPPKGSLVTLKQLAAPRQNKQGRQNAGPVDFLSL